MRAVIQRVHNASVSVDGEEIAKIGKGLCCFVGIEAGDRDYDIDYIARKIVGLRIFDDSTGVMNLDAVDAEAEILLVSQFTLLGDVRKGRRPSYSNAEPPVSAGAIFDSVVSLVSSLHKGRVVTGRFQAEMDVRIDNHGPVTILLDSRKLF